jgi:photosynthetic reaction center cytochrome c subunit
MKLAVLRFIAVALTCVCAVIVISNLRAQNVSANQNKFAPLYSALGMPQPEQTPAAAQEKTIAQEGREKNIKLLGDMPVSQFIPVMNYFAASLGRRCNFCHVNTNGQWDYASDAKPEKNSAREMIRMVLDTNKNFFKGNPDVSCFVCHRGRNNPMSVPPLPLPTPVPPPAGAGGGPGGGAGPGGGGQQPSQPQGSPTPRPTPTPAEEILSKYVTAVGGQAAIDKIKSRTMTGTITTANGQSGTYELIQGADKALETITTPRAAIKLALTSTGGWESNGPNSRELAGGDLARVRYAYQLFSFLKLKEQYTRLRTVGRDRVGDRDAYVVLASRSETEVERLFFDIENGLLLRRITYLRTMIGIIPTQWDFEDYRDVDGVKMPFTIRLSTTDAGNAFSVRKFTEIKLNGPVDDSKFAMPGAAPKP